MQLTFYCYRDEEEDEVVVTLDPPESEEAETVVVECTEIQQAMISMLKICEDATNLDLECFLTLLFSEPYDVPSRAAMAEWHPDVRRQWNRDRNHALHWHVLKKGKKTVVKLGPWRSRPMLQSWKEQGLVHTGKKHRIYHKQDLPLMQELLNDTHLGNQALDLFEKILTAGYTFFR